MKKIHGTLFDIEGIKERLASVLWNLDIIVACLKAVWISPKAIIGENCKVIKLRAECGGGRKNKTKKMWSSKGGYTALGN